MVDENQRSQLTTLTSYMDAYKISRAIYVAAVLGVADQLIAGAKHCDEIAAAIGANPEALYRILRFLAGHEVFKETDHKHFELTPLAQLLRSDTPGSQRDKVILTGGETFWNSWGEIIHCAKTGEAGFDHIYGMNMFDYMNERPDQAKLFHSSMSSYTAFEVEAILSAYDFSKVKMLADIGGGEGLLISAILMAYPELQGILFDQSYETISNKSKVTSKELLARCKIIGGSFFDSVPAGCDTYVLKSVIHDWNHEQSISILDNCRKAIADDSKLLIIERIIPSGNQPSIAKNLDLSMLVMMHGRERTEAEYQSLLEEAHFKVVRIVPTSSPVSIIEAIPI